MKSIMSLETFVVFQNAEFALGSLWRDFCNRDDVVQQGPLSGRNDHKDSHYYLIQYNGSADLDLMPIRVFNCMENTKTRCQKHLVARPP